MGEGSSGWVRTRSVLCGGAGVEGLWVAVGVIVQEIIRSYEVAANQLSQFFTR